MPRRRFPGPIGPGLIGPGEIRLVLYLSDDTLMYDGLREIAER